MVDASQVPLAARTERAERSGSGQVRRNEIVCPRNGGVVDVSQPTITIVEHRCARGLGFSLGLISW